MLLIDFFKNRNTLVGMNQRFEQLLEKGDITAVKDRMVFRSSEVDEAIREYIPIMHNVMERRDKCVTDKSGKVVKTINVWKLPVPYQVFINEIALVFLYGRPVKWSQVSEGTDEAFSAYIDRIKKLRFDSKIRQCKRLAGAETESAMLFRTFQNEDGKADCQIRVLARSKGDEIYTRFDQYENLLAFAWGYYTLDDKDMQVYHFDIFTKDATYKCTENENKWDVKKEQNIIGKIPVIYFKQEKEWAGAEKLIEREENIASRTADTNDYFADPIAVLRGDVAKKMPDKEEAGKLLITNDQDGVNDAVKYLTWDSAPQSKKDEMEWLQTQIMQKTFTPNITTESLKSVSQLSAKALKTVMMLADIKASKRKETHDELLDRCSTLITSIIGNVLDVSLKSQCDKLQVAHEFQEPFGEDVADAITNLIKCADAGIMSQESAIEMNPLVKDATREMERIGQAQEEATQRQLKLLTMQDNNAQTGEGTED